ncbi:MAG: N-acetyltransferase [Lentisphaeria bacterium]|nr:N-acetyltransferase [Lentisphaeria bacterium]
MNIHLRKIEDHEVPLFRREMKSAFEQGVYDRFGALDAAPIPPENEVDEALKDPQFDVFIITADGESAGGTIIKKEGEGRYSLDLLFIFKEFLNKKTGTRAWQAIEAHYPDAVVWKTFTPYFERRNIHFYLHKCHFRIVEFFSEFHREEHDLTEEFKDVNTSGFFRFEKIMDHSKEPR